jgi:hypothetical protein
MGGNGNHDGCVLTGNDAVGKHRADRLSPKTEIQTADFTDIALQRRKPKRWTRIQKGCKPFRLHRISVFAALWRDWLEPRNTQNDTKERSIQKDQTGGNYPGAKLIFRAGFRVIRVFRG